MNFRTVDELLADGPELVTLDARAVRASVDVVARMSVEDLDKPTPCAGWALRDLLEHMIIQHYGFAAASRGEDDLSLWKPQPIGPDPVAEYRAAAEHVLAAFAAEGVLERNFPLPEIRNGVILPAALSISFHFIDYVVHSWDVARTLGIDVEFEDDLLAAGLLVAEAVPRRESRTVPGAAFAPEIERPDGSVFDRILAVLGRSPGWPH
ncbi:TIGR03086 family metal-binding protein [Nocardia sp. NPDC051030]|uniref:TIGR03086 family metal-binding protein n=1 Tax=Nocardia sp. NPDC051030 TaxID=3155162 RepID=UPI00341CE5D5